MRRLDKKISTAVVGVLIGTIVICSVIVIAGINSQLQISSLAAYDWAPIKAKVLKCNVVEYALPKQSTEYDISIKYEYSIDGIKYFGKNFSTEFHAPAQKKNIQSIVDSLIAQEEIDVFYRADVVSNSYVIKPKPPSIIIFFTWIIPLVIALVASAILKKVLI